MLYPFDYLESIGAKEVEKSLPRITIWHLRFARMVSLARTSRPAVKKM
jgi:hypothetical protein